MGAAIYIIKMVIVGSDHYKMGVLKTHGVIKLAFFIICIHTRCCFFIPVASDAPHLALMLWKDLDKWAICKSVLSGTCLR